jgi:hypothetical protein
VSDPAKQPASPRRERSLLGFYIAMAIAAALFGLGVWLYRPLRLRYAIYRVETAPMASSLSSSWHKMDIADKWLLEVRDAARRGDRRAIGVILDHADFRVARRTRGTSVRWEPVVRLVAEDQPERFAEMLAHRRDKQKILELAHLGDSQSSAERSEVAPP